MRTCPIHAVLAAVAALALATSAAHAFTMENKDADGAYSVPKFNLEEQAKNFRKDGSDLSSPGNLSTQIGGGTLQFGVRPGDASTFGTPFNSGPGAWSGTGIGRASRQDFNRVVTPENLR